MENNEQLEIVKAAILEQAKQEGFELSEEEVNDLAEAVLEEGSDDKLDRVFQKHRRDPRAKKNRDEEHKAKKERKMYESIEEMMSSANDQKPVEFGQAFANAMAQKIGDRIEAMRPEVAAQLFNGSEE